MNSLSPEDFSPLVCQWPNFDSSRQCHWARAEAATVRMNVMKKHTQGRVFGRNSSGM